MKQTRPAPSPSPRSNLWKLSVLRGLEFAWFPIPTVVLFYQHHGLSLEQAILLKTILSISIFVFEIPSGYFADVFGRKVSLIWGGMIWVVSLLPYCFLGDFVWFAIAEALSGLAASLISGADVALAFDSLSALDREGEYGRFEGRLGAIAGLSEAVCGLVGAAVAAANLRYPFYLQTLCILTYVALAFTLSEPPRHRSAAVGGWGELRDTLKWTATRKTVRWPIALGAIVSAGTFAIVWLSQAYMGDRGLPVGGFGVAWAAFHGVLSGSALLATPISHLLGVKGALWLMLAVLAGSYGLLAAIHHPWGVIFVATIYFARGLRSPLILTLLNRQVASFRRATVLSINSFAFRLCFAAIGPAIGWISDAYSLDLALAMSGIFFWVAGGICLMKIRV
ncbi:MFS transporter [Lyngbya sp. CCY1209]|uniref:MFS transporter n=1 Tax=Lyngbya sp. CCY1209 TaxID=2886103 RepID=UPI002D20221E|nr:MFS transporter [Lyngbya sp. CCY1209]MEB3883127.1 MFS transporter [Lyngbya sp. CCY1209]